MSDVLVAPMVLEVEVGISRAGIHDQLALLTSYFLSKRTPTWSPYRVFHLQTVGSLIRCIFFNLDPFGSSSSSRFLQSDSDCLHGSRDQKGIPHGDKSLMPIFRRSIRTSCSIGRQATGHFVTWLGLRASWKRELLMTNRSCTWDGLRIQTALTASV